MYANSPGYYSVLKKKKGKKKKRLWYDFRLNHHLSYPEGMEVNDDIDLCGFVFPLTEH